QVRKHLGGDRHHERSMVVTEGLIRLTDRPLLILVQSVGGQQRIEMWEAEPRSRHWDRTPPVPGLTAGRSGSRERMSHAMSPWWNADWLTRAGVPSPLMGRIRPVPSTAISASADSTNGRSKAADRARAADCRDPGVLSENQRSRSADSAAAHVGA